MKINVFIISFVLTNVIMLLSKYQKSKCDKLNVIISKVSVNLLVFAINFIAILLSYIYENLLCIKGLLPLLAILFCNFTISFFRKFSSLIMLGDTYRTIMLSFIFSITILSYLEKNEELFETMLIYFLGFIIGIKSYNLKINNLKYKINIVLENPKSYIFRLAIFIIFPLFFCPLYFIYPKIDDLMVRYCIPIISGVFIAVFLYSIIVNICDKEINDKTLNIICKKHKIQPIEIKRFSTGYGNYVFHVKTEETEYIIRCNSKSYRNTIKSLKKLNSIDIPVSKLLFKGRYKRVYYMICSYIQGDDLGKVYHSLSCKDKKAIAKEVVEIQNKVSQLYLSSKCNLHKWVEQRLQRARYRISQNGYFDTQKVDKLEELLPQFKDYFNNFNPVPYLDDISTKNLLIHNNRVSGIIDTDWIGYGDPLTFVALTNVALLDMQCNTDYVDYLLKEMNVTEEQRKVFLFYSLMYCVDFMGEKGTIFNGNKVAVDESTTKMLNGIFNNILDEIFQYLKI